MADKLPTSAPESPGRRRLFLGLALAPVVGSSPALVRQLVAPAGAAPMVLGVDLAGGVDLPATAIRFFDAAGRLRVVFGSFDHSP